MTTTATPIEAVTGWLERSELVEPLDRAAELVAAALKRDADVTFTLAVGNGYQYRTAISILPADAEAEWGGNMLVSLPEFHRCLLLNDHGDSYHFPDYVEEKLELGAPHSPLLAAFLTLLSHHRR